MTLLARLDVDAGASELATESIGTPGAPEREGGGDAEATRATAAREPEKPPFEAGIPDATEHTGARPLRSPAAADVQIPQPPIAATEGAGPSGELASLPPMPRVVAGTRTVDYAAVDYSRWSPLQRVGQALFRILFRIVAPVEVEGLENIPPSGPVLLAVNHLSMLDLPLLVTVLPRRTICIATETLRRFAWLRSFLDIGDTIYVRRGEADQQALDHGLAVLRAGGLLGVAPEGTRSPSGGLTRGHSGVAYLATEAQAPILPVVAYGQEQVVHNLKRLRRTRVHVRIGSLISPSPGETTAARLLRDTERVMTALAAMLPPAYRGLYADAVEESHSPEADARSAR
jgi:1-acyl-sn-glycerol-3-phosphate acyltransferase